MTARLPNAARLLFLLAAGGLFLSLIAAMLVPVYTDETGWRFQERAAIDGVDILFSDLCGPNTLARPPWHMMPARWFSAIANLAMAAPLFVRSAGVLCALAWASLLWILIRRIECDAMRRNLLGAVAYALLGLGVLPFILALSRPEQPIILTTTLILIVTFARAPRDTNANAAALKILLILILSAIAQSYHMKGVLYTALALIAVIVCARGRATLAPRMAGMALLLVLTASSAHYWLERLKCPDNAKLAAMYAKENIAAALAGDLSIMNLAGHVISGVNPFNYVLLAAPVAKPMSFWLPPDMFSPLIFILASGLLLICWGLAIGTTCVLLGRCLLIRRVSALSDPRWLAALTLLAIVAIWGASQLNRNVYEAAHVLPALVLALLLALTLPTSTSIQLNMWLRRAACAAVPLALTNQIVMLAIASGPLLAAYREPGYIHDQPFSVSVRGYSTTKSYIFTAMEKAGVPTDHVLNRIVVDELTYLALQDSHLPLHRLGVLSVWNGGITDPVTYLRNKHSDGVIVGCHLLSERLRLAASQAGPICAISRATLDRLAMSR